MEQKVSPDIKCNISSIFICYETYMRELLNSPYLKTINK